MNPKRKQGRMRARVAWEPLCQPPAVGAAWLTAVPVRKIVLHEDQSAVRSPPVCFIKCVSWMSPL